MVVARKMPQPDPGTDESRAPGSDPFPSTEFDPWAETYDQDVVTASVFPFDGYDRLLDTVVRLAEPRAGMSVLDLGTGTGNLALRLAGRGCELWCTDFSEAMLEQARRKLPAAHFVLQDLRAAWPSELDRRFDRIVSAYVFHHFELEQKVSLCRALVEQHLQPEGRLVIADISFRDAVAMDHFAQSVGQLWESEPYWLADPAIEALQAVGLVVDYVQASACAGVYTICPKQNLHAVR